MRVVALIPAYNEADVIAATVLAVKQIKPLAKIVVINDGSTDDTAVIVQSFAGISLLNLPENKGKGTALNLGWQSTQADVYLLLDADLGATASLAKELLTPVLAKEVDQTVACFHSRQTRDGGQMGFGMVRRLAVLGVRFLTGQKVNCPLSGQRAVSADLLNSLGGFLPGFGVEIGLTIGALQKGFLLREIVIPMKHRASGRGLKGIVHRGRQLRDVIWALWHCWRQGGGGR